MLVSTKTKCVQCGDPFTYFRKPSDTGKPATHCTVCRYRRSHFAKSYVTGKNTRRKPPSLKSPRRAGSSKPSDA